MKVTQLIQEIKSKPLTESVTLDLNKEYFKIESNDASLIQELREYYHEWVTEDTKTPHSTVVAWQCETPSFDLDYQEYRETPEKRIKEVYADFESYRIVQKTKTGVHFIVGNNEWYALGPLTMYPNQVINFVNAIFMEINLEGDAFLFHAAGVSKDNKGIVIAAQSGKGKSTTSLFLVNKGLDFVSNDRVILQKDNGNFTMIGVPKHPRVNPGTLLNNPMVKHLLKDPERFEDKTREEIWNWEEKYDVIIPEIYGDGKFPLSAKAMAFLIIDWGDNEEALKLEKLDIKTRLDLLPAIMKIPSLMTPNIYNLKKDHTADEYVDFLGDLPLFVLTGKIDTEKGLQLIQEAFFQ